jgi:hypothetical protein
VQPVCVVVDSAVLGQDFRFEEGVELLDSEQLVTQGALNDSTNAFCHGAPESM